ncbi:magnesium transporter CorA family protein [Paenibacillus oenotherae]|uniref:Magnesium transporter CorA family protein n=1 Tax=Paenibacillus oenotherae TaxID=1435645 RepID=A0ABS7D5B6_9BACL|nr:magnesium transporter CorA family protein [Paenibacillus oenotherae]MBW7474666.1 magnesium transporter CorA family protein [Paenibacillus oenotherae]
MMHRMLRFSPDWEWHVLLEQRPATTGLSRRHRTNEMDTNAAAVHTDAQADRMESIRAIKAAHPEVANWLDDSESCQHNHIVVSELPGGEPVLHGTLLYQASDEQQDVVPLHFWMNNDKLVTLHSDMRLSIRLQLEPWEEKLNRCKTAPEAFFVMLGAILETFHTGLDDFEKRLGELEQTMRLSNGKGLMNSIFERRYDLLHWNHLFIAIYEVHGAAKEAFMEALTEQEEFKRMAFKLQRIQALLDQYALEIDTLLTMDDAISNFRGNDIMKTLTIFTVLLSPATVIGAMWGMNFELIPWARQTWGFVAMCLITVMITIGIYWWLRRKGWTGDLLNSTASKKEARKKLRSTRAIAAPKQTGDAPLSRRGRAASRGGDDDDSNKGNSHIG